MNQVQSKTATDKLHLAELSIVVSTRAAGSAIFSGVATAPLLCRVAWMPKGFPDDEVKRVLDGYVPVQLFDAKRTPVMPTKVVQNPHRGSFNDLPSFSQPDGAK